MWAGGTIAAMFHQSPARSGCRATSAVHSEILAGVPHLAEVAGADVGDEALGLDFAFGVDGG
jgi:hypothetical protein